VKVFSDFAREPDFCNGTKNRILPDIFIEPAVVIEVLGAEITESPRHTAVEEKGKQGLHCDFLAFYASDLTKDPVKQLQLKR
jgi:ATP-dependent DNA ligase